MNNTVQQRATSRRKRMIETQLASPALSLLVCFTSSIFAKQLNKHFYWRWRQSENNARGRISIERSVTSAWKRKWNTKQLVTIGVSPTFDAAFDDDGGDDVDDVDDVDDGDDHDHDHDAQLFVVRSLFTSDTGHRKIQHATTCTLSHPHNQFISTPKSHRPILNKTILKNNNLTACLQAR